MNANESYDEKLFVKPLSEEFKCPICLNIMKDPVQCSTQGHTFCRNCVSEHLDLAETCPTCREPLTKAQLLPSRLIRSLIEDAEVHCLSYEASQNDKIKSRKKSEVQFADVCYESTKLREAQGHYDQCLFARIECPHIGCDDVILRKYLPEHIDNCLHRLVCCNWCNLRRKVDVLEAHLLVCPELPVPCPNSCLGAEGVVMSFSPSDVPHHRSLCTMEVVGCKFMTAGCDVKMVRQDMALHEVDAGAHIGCLLVKIIELDHLSKSQAESIQSLRSDNESKELFHNVPVSELADVKGKRSRTINVGGQSFHLHLSPEKDGWHSLCLFIEKDVDWEGSLDVEVTFEVVSYSGPRPAEQTLRYVISKSVSNRGFSKYMESTVLKSEGCVKDGHIMLKANITIRP